MDRYFIAGDTAYKVLLYGATEEDPSREIEPGSEHFGQDDALAEARRLLEGKIGHEDGLWWSAEISKGEWVGYSDDDGHDWIEFEDDESETAKWLVLIGGKVVDQDADA